MRLDIFSLEHEVEALISYTETNRPGPLIRDLIRNRLKDIYSILENGKYSIIIPHRYSGVRRPIKNIVTGNIYDSIGEAAEYLGIHRAALRYHLTTHPDGNNKYNLKLVD